MKSRFDNASKVTINARVMPMICTPLTDQHTDFARQNYEHLKTLELAETGEGTGQVDILVGSDFYWDVFSGKVSRGVSGPVGLDSKVGWVLSGLVEGLKPKPITSMLNTCHALRINIEQNELQSSVNRF